jgi:PKD repeat protein
MAAEQIGTHKYSKAGEYIVTLEIKHPKTNKTIASSKEVMTVIALPEPDYTFVQSSEAIPTVSFTNKTEDVENIMWNVKGLKQSTNPDFEYTFRKAGTYSVGLTATNEFGCSKTIEKSVKIDKDYNLLAPNAFAPNGDGDNDNFIPLALKIMDVEFTMTIMDKSGRQVYVTQNAFSPWDGRLTSDNTMAPSGSSYIWRVVLTNSNGEPELYEGQVFVVY